MKNQCTATNRAGTRCGRAAIAGGTVCHVHGGAAPQVRARARQRVVQAGAAKLVAEWGGRVDIDPAQALVGLVQAKAREVGYWDAVVSNLVAVAHPVGPEVKLLHEAQDQLASYAIGALRIGAEEAIARLTLLQAAWLSPFATRVVETARQHADMPAQEVIRTVLVDAEQHVMVAAKVSAAAEKEQACLASQIQTVIMHTLQRLQLSDEQWDAAPGIIVEELDRLLPREE